METLKLLIPAQMTQYIVVLKKGSEKHLDTVKRDLESKGAKVTNTFDGTVLLGHVVDLPDNLVSSFEAHPHVDYIEKDGKVSIN